MHECQKLMKEFAKKKKIKNQETPYRLSIDKSNKLDLGGSPEEAREQQASIKKFILSRKG